MTGPRSAIYNTRGHSEDISSLLGSIQERQKVILIFAYEIAAEHPRRTRRTPERLDEATQIALQRIFEEAASMAREITQARRIVQRHWCKIQALIDAEE